jgi:outer membrane lipase/esterase
MSWSSRKLLNIALAFGVAASCANAGTIDQIYAFGDSLSDVGNVFIGTGGTIPPPPYVNGQFSNGPVWVQYLAAGLGLAPLTPSLAGGTDYAYGSGETGLEPFNLSDPRTDVLGAAGQLAQYQGFLTATHTTADPNALYTIWIGSNDLADVLASNPDPSTAAADVGIVAANIGTIINQLSALGAKNFLVVNVPDLGASPLAGTPAARTALSQLSGALDTTLAASLGGVASADHINLQLLNSYLLLDSIISSPATYRLTNVSDECFNGNTVCSNPDQYLFWDDQHPTTAGHAIVANAALALVNSPEPKSISLIGLGLGLVGFVLIQRRAKA